MINLASLTNWNFFLCIIDIQNKQTVYLQCFQYGLAVSARALKLPPLQKSVYLRIIINQNKLISLFFSSKIDSLNKEYDFTLFLS